MFDIIVENYHWNLLFGIKWHTFHFIASILRWQIENGNMSFIDAGLEMQRKTRSIATWYCDIVERIETTIRSVEN